MPPLTATRQPSPARRDQAYRRREQLDQPTPLLERNDLIERSIDRPRQRCRTEHVPGELDLVKIHLERRLPASSLHE